MRDEFVLDPPGFALFAGSRLSEAYDDDFSWSRDVDCGTPTSSSSSRIESVILVY
jgi:hypothetical protein